MILAFIFYRLGDNKWHAPLLREALLRGHKVEIWLDQHDISKTTKWYEFPDFAKFPEFLPGHKPEVRVFYDAAGLVELSRQSSAQVVITPMLPVEGRNPKQIWAHVISCLFEPLNVFKAKDALRFDYVFFNTDYWVEQGIRYYEIMKQLERGSIMEAELRKRFVATGSSQFDHFPFTDREAERRALGVPDGKKVVTLIALEVNAVYWAHRIFLEPKIWKRIFSWLVLPFSYAQIFSKIGRAKIIKVSFISLWDRVRMFWATFFSASDVSAMMAVRKFCDHNGYFFILKARKKHPLLPHHYAIPDHVIEEDTQFFPATAFRVMAATDMLITMYSAAGYEASSARIPMLNFVPPFGISYSRGQFELAYREFSRERELANELLLYHPTEGGVFNFPGVNQSWSVNRAVRELPGKTIADFPVDPTAHHAFMEKYISPGGGGPSAPRILDFLERAAEQRKNK